MSGRREWTRVLATVAFAAFCVASVELWRPPAAADDTMVFAMSVEGDDGEVLGSPVVLGAAGQRVQVNLVCQDDPRRERMSLTLDPVTGADGSLRYSYSLSVPGRFTGEHGTVELSPGQEKRISLRQGDPRGVTLALFAAPVTDRRVERYLRERRARRGRLST